MFSCFYDRLQYNTLVESHRKVQKKQEFSCLLTVSYIGFQSMISYRIQQKEIRIVVHYYYHYYDHPPKYHSRAVITLKVLHSLSLSLALSLWRESAHRTLLSATISWWLQIKTQYNSYRHDVGFRFSLHFFHTPSISQPHWSRIACLLAPTHNKRLFNAQNLNDCRNPIASTFNIIVANAAALFRMYVLDSASSFLLHNRLHAM